VDVPRQTCVAACRWAATHVDVHASTRVDVRNVNVARSWRLVRWRHEVRI